MEVSQQVSERLDELIEAAKRVHTNAHAPYSNFKVGAAVLTEKGEIYVGCNVETSSYGLTICGERNCIGTAVAAEGETLKILALAIYTAEPKATPPCGACRQWLTDFNPDMLVISVCDTDHRKETTARELLPEFFGPHSMTQNG